MTCGCVALYFYTYGLPHCTEGMAGEALKEAIDFECSLEQVKLRTIIAALLTSASIWALVNEIGKVFPVNTQFFVNR